MQTHNIPTVMQHPNAKLYIDCVRVTHASRHNGGPIEAPPVTSRYHITVMFEEFDGTVKWARMMPKGDSFLEKKICPIVADVPNCLGRFQKRGLGRFLS